ncbi:hypothetical protein J6590_001138 [Homalodisca vitripennis]|nr:hypothetical protein J6590_001138 [Homalodisca vitripennis]
MITVGRINSCGHQMIGSRRRDDGRTTNHPAIRMWMPRYSCDLGDSHAQFVDSGAVWSREWMQS